MQISEFKVVVFCSTAKTGGPEVLHQLVYQLRLLGKNAFVCYYPFDIKHNVHDEYLKYETPICSFDDDGDTFFIIPESATFISKLIDKSRYGVWWLSVDNYFRVKKDSLLRDFIYKNLSLFRSRAQIRSLKKAQHFTQSEYAKNFLMTCGIESKMLTDYLGDEHAINSKNNNSSNRKNIIVYNPKKGVKTTKKVIETFKNFSFVPIQNMRPDEVVSLLKMAKIYIDFGNHPGKDRLPREAASSGCCVITNIKGSAKNNFDISIPNGYKLDELSPSFHNDFSQAVNSIFLNFENSSKDFDDYRLSISLEREGFKAQVKAIFL